MWYVADLFADFIAAIKVGLNEFASLLSNGAQKSQIEHYITEI